MSKICTIIFFLGLAGLSAATSCTQQYQCSSVSTDYNYVNCVNGNCQCISGFSGNATASNPCNCPYTVNYGGGNPYCINCQSPRRIIYDENGKPECVNIAECGTENQQSASQKAIVTRLYQYLVKPMPSKIIANPSLVSDIFEPTVNGRITPVGDYTDMEGTIEYFYGLAGSSITNIYIIDLISSGNTVAVRVDLQFDQPRAGNLPSIYNITQTGFFHFNSAGRIAVYDLTLLRLGDSADPTPGTEDYYRQAICQVAVAYCNTSAPYLAYSDYDSCMSFLRTIPVGSYNRADSNSVVCRIIHTQLVPLRPQYHCAHIGPTGGHKCVDFPYEQWYAEPYY